MFFKIFIYFVLSLFILLYMVWVFINRENPKLIEIMPIIVGATITVLFSIVASDNNFQSGFNHKFFSDRDGSNCLSFCSDPVLRDVYRFHTKLNVKVNDNEKPLQLTDFNESSEFVSMAILSSLFENYFGGWNHGDQIEKDVDFVKVKDLENSINKSKFFSIFQKFVLYGENARLAVPKNTEIFFELPSTEKSYAEIRFTKKFLNLFTDFDIRIKIRTFEFKIGLDVTCPHFPATMN